MDTLISRNTSSAAKVGVGWAMKVLAGLAVVAGLWAGSDFLIPVAMSATLAVLLWPSLGWLERIFHSRALSAFVAVMLTMVFTGGLAMAVGSKLSSATEQLPSALRLVARDVAALGNESARAVLRTRSALTELDRTVARATGTVTDHAEAPRDPDAAAPRSIVAQMVDGVGRLAIAASKSAAGVLLQAGMIALLTFFMLCSGDTLSARLTHWCCASVAGPSHCAPMLVKAAHQIRMFAGVTVITNISIGIGVGLGFALFGVPDAWMWGVAAAALHFLPYAGLAIMMGLAALEVYVVQASMLTALGAACYVMVVGIVIGTAMAVWLQGRVARIDSATLFAGTIFWSVLWGGWGLVLGPLLVVVAQLLWKEAPLLRGLSEAPVDSEVAAACVDQAGPGNSATPDSLVGA